MSDMEANQSAQNCEILSSTIEAELSGLPPYSKGSFISKVPKLLRQVNEAAFAPLILSIGPLHHKDESFLPTEALKLNYLKSFLAASSSNTNLTAFLRAIIDQEMKIRDCYTYPIHLSANEFTRMVLTDSAFIIELFRKSYYPSLREDDDPFFQGSHKLMAVRRDLLLAENQLPSFVLVDLYWMAFEPVLNDLPKFTDIASNFFGLDKPYDPIESKEMDNVRGQCHLLNLSRYQYPYPYMILKSSPGWDTITCPTATRLFEAGVKFRAGNPSSLLGLSFNLRTRVLTIPKLKLTDESEASLRNSIAFEECDSRASHYVTNYAYFMDCLINTAKDVELLVKAGVVENFMGDNEGVAELINSLCKHVDASFALKTHYRHVCEDLNGYYAKSWNRHKATLKQTYFSHPWAAISVVYAFVMLLLTIAQVVTGVISLW